MQERIGWGKKVAKRRLNNGVIDVVAEAGLLEKFYDFIQTTANKSIGFHDFLPFPQSEVYIPIRAATVQEAAVKYKQLVHITSVNSAMAVSPTGGVESFGDQGYHEIR